VSVPLAFGLAGHAPVGLSFSPVSSLAKQANLDDRRFSGRLPFLAYTGGLSWRRVQEVGVQLLVIDQASS
jgi:hypothetical protein